MNGKFKEQLTGRTMRWVMIQVESVFLFSVYFLTGCLYVAAAVAFELPQPFDAVSIGTAAGEREKEKQKTAHVRLEGKLLEPIPQQQRDDSV